MKKLATMALLAAACSSGSTDNGRRDSGDPGFTTGDLAQAASTDGATPDDFWGDTTHVPAASQVMTFKFLNRTNGKYSDAEVYWRFKNDTVNELHSIADAPTYDMPANNSGRMYFYLCASTDAACVADPTTSKYYDFIEHTIGAAQYNGNTTRVDAFGLKIAMRLHCADGFDKAVGEDYATFAEDRTTTFQRFTDAVPDAFKASVQAPYRIVQPGAGGFDAGGAHANYYDAYVDTMWANNGITVPKPGPNGSGLGSYPDLSAAIYRHVGDAAGTFDKNGKRLDMTLWDDATTFYQTEPYDAYARFWHDNAIDGRAYGFPYDDVGGYSTYVSHDHPQYMLVAIGW